MNKKMKFNANLVPLVLSGGKVSTWRLWDDKDLKVGDIVDFLESGTGKHFASGRLTKVIQKRLGELTEEDKSGHEKFSSDENMYKTYKDYYQREVGPMSIVKIIWFELI